MKHCPSPCRLSSTDGPKSAVIPRMVQVSILQWNTDRSLLPPLPPSSPLRIQKRFQRLYSLSKLGLKKFSPPIKIKTISWEGWVCLLSLVWSSIPDVSHWLPVLQREKHRWEQERNQAQAHTPHSEWHILPAVGHTVPLRGLDASMQWVTHQFLWRHFDLPLWFCSH